MPKNTFYIGFASAGAISAGAYSAGVLDFLIFALDEWANEVKDTDQQVVLPVFSGASAGSITSAVGIIAASRVKSLTPATGSQAEHYLKALYDCWVVGPDLTSSPNGALLDIRDIQNDPKVCSLLDSTALDDIANSAFIALANLKPVKPSYFPKKLHLYMTQTNTRGVPYEIGFAATAGYGMLCHADRVHYVISGLGTSTFNSKWAAPDQAWPINISTLTPTNNLPSVWNDYIQNTIASGAFPVGLMARPFPYDTDAYNNRSWPLPYPPRMFAGIRPNWPANWSPLPHKYDYSVIDGGVINNHPFEYTRYTLMDNPPIGNNQNPANADRAVIMVNPFPEPPSFILDDNEALDNSLLTIVKRLLPTMLNQNRFKPDELMLALDNNTASRWLISPRRYINGHLQEFGIACGLLSGFGGFVDREFREHDYELGRKNCQEFLSRWFGMDQSNPNVSNGMLPQITNGLKHNQSSNKPVIPLRVAALTPVNVRAWPQIAISKLDSVADKASARANKIIPLMLPKTILGKLICLFYKTIGRGKVRDFIYYTCLADLTRRNQASDSDFAALNDIERKVLSACMAPEFDYRTALGIAHDLGMNGQIQIITNTIAKLLQQKLLYQYVALLNTKQWYTYEPRGHFYDINPNVN